MRAYFLLQSGHGHWSQPQPVHAWRITRAFYPPTVLQSPPPAHENDLEQFGTNGRVLRLGYGLCVAA